MKTFDTHVISGHKNPSNHFSSIIRLAASIILILLFTHTGLGKILYHDIFWIQLRKQPLPLWSKPMLHYTLPVIEIGIALLLCFAKTQKQGFLLAAMLMTAYTIYAFLAYIEIYGHIICACGKIFQNMNWRDHFLVNTALSIASYFGLFACYYVERNKTIATG